MQNITIQQLEAAITLWEKNKPQFTKKWNIPEEKQKIKALEKMNSMRLKFDFNGDSYLINIGLTVEDSKREKGTKYISHNKYIYKNNEVVENAYYGLVELFNNFNQAKKVNKTVYTKMSKGLVKLLNTKLEILNEGGFTKSERIHFDNKGNIVGELDDNLYVINVDYFKVLFDKETEQGKIYKNENDIPYIIDDLLEGYKK